jgi:hypothetical protein
MADSANAGIVTEIAPSAETVAALAADAPDSDYKLPHKVEVHADKSQYDPADKQTHSPPKRGAIESFGQQGP